MENHILVASCDRQGGILRYALGEDGKLALTDRVPLDRPMYFCREGNRLFVILREPFPGQSAVAQLRTGTAGTLVPEGDLCPVHGSIACHILSFAGRIYTANYASGSVTRLPDRVVTFAGHGPLPQQECSHPHGLTPTPDGKYLCVCDLGADCIRVCSAELEEVSRTAVKPGSGPRHLVFSRDGRFAYCANELSSEVSVFGYGDGELTLLDTRQSIPEDWHGENYPSAIRLNREGNKLYVANRGHDSVCIWDAEGAVLSGRRFVPSGGRMPREMNVAGPWVLCGNRDCLAVVSEETGEAADRVPVPQPWCILPESL